MTQHDFAQGWKLLIVQPWGKLYRSLTDEGQMSEEAKIQMQFYYEKLKFAHKDAWIKTAELYAEGAKWPSLSEVRDTLSMFHRRCVTALTDQSQTTDRVPMPEEIRKKLQEGGILNTMPTDRTESI